MKTKFPTPVLFFLAPILFLSFSCGESPDHRPHIILIVPDALRARQLPCYGYDQIETPHIDRLAEDAVLFQYALVKTPVTQPSFSNLFSGLLFPMNCLRWGEKTLAQYLKENGYKTMGAVGSRVLSTWAPAWKGKKNFDKGFDEYIQDAALYRKPYTRQNEEITRDITGWLEQNRNSRRPLFLFAHYIDPHAPCDPHYDGEIVKIDRELGKIVKKLKELNLYEEAMIFFTSDHGESLEDPVEDHGSLYGHGWFTYTEQVRVPLIIKFPRQKHRKTVGQIARNIDILPTILDTIGAKYEEGKFDGVSLLPAIREDKPLDLVSYHSARWTRLCPEGTVSVIFKFKGNLYQFIRGEFSHRNPELYDLTHDPGEHTNLAYHPGHTGTLSRGKQLLYPFIEKDRRHKKGSNSGGRRKKGKRFKKTKQIKKRRRPH